jgi:hypothetical protein
VAAAQSLAKRWQQHVMTVDRAHELDAIAGD